MCNVWKVKIPEKMIIYLCKIDNDPVYIVVVPSHDLPEGSFEALIIMPPQNRSKHSQDNAHCKYQVCHGGLCPAAQHHQQS